VEKEKINNKKDKNNNNKKGKRNEIFI